MKTLESLKKELEGINSNIATLRDKGLKIVGQIELLVELSKEQEETPK